MYSSPSWGNHKFCLKKTSLDPAPNSSNNASAFDFVSASVRWKSSFLLDFFADGRLWKAARRGRRLNNALQHHCCRRGSGIKRSPWIICILLSLRMWFLFCICPWKDVGGTSSCKQMGQQWIILDLCFHPLDVVNSWRDIYLFLGVSSIARKVNNIRICWWPRSPSFFMVYEGWKAPLRIARRRTWSSWRVESFHGWKVYKLQDVGRIAFCSCFFEDPKHDATFLWLGVALSKG